MDSAMRHHHSQKRGGESRSDPPRALGFHHVTGRSRAAFAVLYFFLAMVAASCTSSGDAIQGTDDYVFFPAVRVTLPFIGNEKTLTRNLTTLVAGAVEPPASEASAESAGEAPPVSVSPSLALDFGYGYGHGRSHQDLSAGEVIRLDNDSISGPARVATGYDLHYFDVAVRGGMWLGDRVGLEGMGGLGIQYTRVELESGGVHDSERTTRGSMLLGVQGTIKIIEWLFVYGRGAWTLGYMESAEAGVETRVYRGIGLMAGWKWWDFQTDRDNKSALDLNFSGPFAGLHVTF